MTTLANELLALFKPPKKMTCTEWAEAERILSAENCALPGKYRMAVTPFLEEILNCVNDPIVTKLVCMKSAQVAWTDGVVNNAIGYHIDQDPCPAIVLFPTEDMAERYSKEKLAPMIRDTNVLREKVANPKSKTSGNTLLSKNYPGGHLELVGSNAPSKLASSPIRLIIVEEPDRCSKNSGGEGSSLKLVYERGKTFHNRKIILGGSPTIKGESEIEREMLLSDQRRCHIPCPHCGEYQTLEWSMVKWDKIPGKTHDVFGENVPESARLECKCCKKHFNNAEKNRQLSKRVWKATAPFRGTAGFYISELYSPFPKARLSDIVEKFLEAKKYLDNGDPTLMITFVNTSLGETWEEKGEQLEEHLLYARREEYKAQVPEGALVLTCAADIQRNRIESEVVGWGENYESWGIEYKVFYGDTSMPEVWDDLDEYLKLSFEHESGASMGLACSLIDSSDGERTRIVYDFVKNKQSRRIFALKGMPGADRPVVSHPTNQKVGRNNTIIQLFGIGVDAAKKIWTSRLRIDKCGAGYCHFPMSYDHEYFDQLTAEKLVTRYKKGYQVKEWHKTRARNEALDIRVYNLAACVILNPVWSSLREKLKPKEEVEETGQQQRRTINKPRSSFVQGWRR